MTRILQTRTARLSAAALWLLVALAAAPVSAQDKTAQDEATQDEATQDKKDAEATFTVPVNVKHGTTGESLAGKGVILRASRPKGPFEPQEPKPRHEWAAQTNDQGTAFFEEVPVGLTNTGLQLYAVTTHGDLTFKSARVTPSKAAHLTVEVYEKAQSTDSLRIAQLRTVPQVWEQNIYFTQYWSLTVDGKKAIDVSVLPGEKFTDGLPLELPLKAKNIQVNGPGDTEIVNSTVNWKGVLKPHETVNLRINFRMTAEEPTFVYRHQIDYPVDSVEVIAPLTLNPEKAKFSRLNDLELAAPGFETVEFTRQPAMLRAGEYLQATGKSLEAGESFSFKLYGLPFDNPTTPWAFFGLGLLGAAFVLFFGLRIGRTTDTAEGRREAVQALREQREELLDELAAVEAARQDGDIDEVEYETESLRLRERIGLIVRKIEELEDNASS